MIQGPGARPTDVERDESLIANRGGFSFLFVHGWTWIAAAALTLVLPIKVAALVYLFQGFVAFPLSLLLEHRLGYKTLSMKENSLVSLFVLIAVAQGLALPASIVVYNLNPLYLPVVFAATNGGHFLPYSWLHRTKVYVFLAIVAAFGPFAILIAGGAEASFHASGFVVGVVMVISAWYVRASAERRIAVPHSSSVGPVPVR
jgi:hypothetical protein